MTVTPLILGSGRSGQAIAKSLTCLQLARPELNIEAPVWLKRDSSLADARKKYSRPVLCIANPHGLHARSILDADRAGYAAILCEKPACINLDEVHALREVKTPVAILHVYRQTWGLQTLKRLLDEQTLGRIITIEGRYWQASAAERALHQKSHPAQGWKDDPRLSGALDTYLDLGTHWIDAVSFLMGATPNRIDGWRSYINSETSHRDSHVQLTLDYPQGRALGSISKTVHGATNHFEINVLGSQGSATWQFLQPDEIILGVGRDRKVMTRKDTDLGSRQPPYHGMGWLEGYIEIASCLLDEAFGQKKRSYPHLATNLDILEAMFQARWQEER